MVLGKLPVPGSPTIWFTVRQGPTALAACGGCLDILLSSILSLFLPLFGRRKYCLKGPLNPNQPTNQPMSEYQRSKSFFDLGQRSLRFQCKYFSETVG